MDYDDLVKYLLDIREEEAADAITKLRAERDALKDELRRTCEHLGLDHLLAERDALRARVAELEKGCDTLTAAAMASYKRAERAEADLAATRADAERYRKLRSSAYKIYLFHNGEHYTVELPSPGYFPPSEFDAAIDRALAGKDAP